MAYFRISNWETNEWNKEIEAIAKDKFGPLIMSHGASSVDFIQTSEMTMSVVTKYKNEATATSGMEKISEIRGQAVHLLYQSEWLQMSKVKHS